MKRELFSDKATRDYFSQVMQMVEGSIAILSDEEITESDISEWEDYFYQEFEVHPIELIDSGITQTIKEQKIERLNRYRFHHGEPEYYYIDGVRINYTIPFDGDVSLLFLQPSMRILAPFSCESIKNPTDCEYGYIHFGLEFEREDLERHSVDMQGYVASEFDKAFSNHRKMIQYINDEVRLFNRNLKDAIKRYLMARRKRADSMAFISKQLEIPLSLKENAPNTKPIPLKRIARPAHKKPSKKPIPTEYTIRDEDYNNINNIIYMCGSAMEKTARSHISNDEEELRDLILATLNTHYENAAGETFRKIGKTDIHILFENQAAFVGECKIWRGEKVFSDAIQQLFGYSTWKDTKVTVVIFNKHNKNFHSILSKIEEWITGNTKSHIRKNANRWDCIFYRADTETDVKLHILAFDLYVDEKQCNEKRT